ncbi:hypothetical protein ACFLRB_01255 [Acidobacteriota bacterium]
MLINLKSNHSYYINELGSYAYWTRSSKWLGGMKPSACEVIQC